MFIEIRHIRAFLAVASELHFGRAANQLHIAQPALSRTIQNLEALLDVQLLERSTRSVQLTVAGQLFYDQFAKLIRQMADAIQATQRVGHGDIARISVGYIDAALCGPMPEILRRFQREHPVATVELSQLTPDKLTELLIERRVDCGFVWGPVKDVKLDGRCIQSEPPVAVLPVSHRLALKPRLAMQDLANERFITCGKDGWQVLQRLCVQSGFSPNLHQEVPSLEAVLAFVAAEVGIGICPSGIQKSARGGVLVKPLINTCLTFDLHCVWHRENTSRFVANFAATATRYLVSRHVEAEAKYEKVRLAPAS